MLWVLICTAHLTVCSYHVTYVTYVMLRVSEGTPCSKQAQYLTFKWLQQHSNLQHLVPKQTLNHLAKLAKWLRIVMSTYLYGAFDCMLLSCHICVSEWIQTLYLSECQGNPCSKQAQYLKFIRLKFIHIGQTGQMIELCCEYLSVRCIWHSHSIFVWMSRNSLFETDTISEV